MLRSHIDTFLPDEAPDRWLFTVGNGPMYDNDIDWRWRATRTSAGCHMCGSTIMPTSGLIAAGCDVVTVQRALEHSSATTTLNTYSHLWPTAEDRTRAAAAGLMRQAMKPRPELPSGSVRGQPLQTETPALPSR